MTAVILPADSVELLIREYRVTHGAIGSHQASRPPRGGILPVARPDAARLAAAHVPAVRLRAELPLPAVGLPARQRRQRGADPSPRPATQPPKLHLHRPARP